MSAAPVIDLFAGAGGWDEGLRSLGIAPLGIELDPDACATREAAGHPTLQADVAALDPLDFAPCPLLIGSPPCPTFSAAGDRLGHLLTSIILDCARATMRGDDTRQVARAEACRVLHPIVLRAEEAKARKRGRPVDLAKVERKARRDADMSLLVVEPLRWAVALQPGLIALEQVPGVLLLWHAFGDLLRPLGYSVWAGKLSAETFGVPQTRERAFLLASLHGPVEPPRATRQAYEPGVPAQELHTLEGTLLPWVSMAEALGWGATGRPVTTLTAGSNRQGSHNPLDGGSGSRATKDGLLVGRQMAEGEGESVGGWGYERPSTTVAGDPRLGSPGHRDREGGERQFQQNAVRVTLEEAAILQGFPPDYPFQGSRTARFTQVGNAVPPPLTRAVIEALLAPAGGNEQP